MNRLRRRVLAAITTAPLWPRAAAQGKAAARAPRAVGYLPWWMSAGWQAMPLAQLDRIVLFDSPIGRDGRLGGHSWIERAVPFLNHAKRSRMPVEVALTLPDHEGFTNTFGDAARRSRLLADCGRWLERPWLAGLHLDIEGYEAASPEAIAGFRQWLAALHDLRQAAGKGLSAFFPASDVFSIFDRPAAGRIDYWVAQVYDAHWKDARSTGPLVTRDMGNNAAVPRALARLAALGAAPAQIVLSAPLYGWEWPAASDRPGAPTQGAGKLLTYAETPKELMPNDRLFARELARRHGLRRDAEHSPYYVHRQSGQWIQGWFEDLESLKRKLAPEREAGYAGMAFFALGYDRNEIVDGLNRWWRLPVR